MSNNDIHQPHDFFVKSNMQDLDIAERFLTHYLPPAFREDIEPGTLSLESTEFLTDDFSRNYADMLYRFMTKSGRHRYAYCLVEHQSAYDKSMAFRIAGYNHLIVKRHIEQADNNQYPLVANLILYNGASPWNGPRSILELYDEDERDLAQQMFLGEAPLIDLNLTSDESLMLDAKLATMLFPMKYIRLTNIELFFEKIQPVMELIGQIEDKQLRGMLHYVLNEFADASYDELVSSMRQLPKKVRREMMTIAERIQHDGIEQGVKQGVKQGVEQGVENTLLAQEMLISGRNETDIIAKTGLDKQAIEKIKKHLKH